MDWNLLAFLAEPAFVVPWYALGIAGAVWVGYDLSRTNTPLKTAMKWAWPIIVLFFSVIGLALYFGTARAPGIDAAQSDDEKQQRHDDYERSMFRRVNGAVIHCVAGDGLGIMTAMVIARLLRLTFWQEFWFEYAVGFAFGLFIFQYKSMRMMTDSPAKALAMAFRAEFFSMLTVMGGMGAVMTYVTPMVVGAQPQPLTFAFWGFGMLGLLIGYLFTFPMNWMIVKIGWKHGMGSMEGARTAQDGRTRLGLGLAMVVLGCAALVLPAWLTALRVGAPVAVAAGAATVGGAAGAAPGHSALAALLPGLRDDLDAAARGLQADRRAAANTALDAATRVAEVGHTAAPGSVFGPALAHLRDARRALQNGDAPGAHRRVAALLADLADGVPAATQRPAAAARYAGVPVLDRQGVVVGEVVRAAPDRLELALGGARDIWGFWDWPPQRVMAVAPDAVVLGPRRSVGKSFVALPGVDTRTVTSN
jgi:hypothetical protein